MARALMLVTGTVALEREDDIAAGHHPRKDYFELAAALNADMLDHRSLPTGRWGTLLRRCLGASTLLAWQGFRRRGRYALLYSDSEAIGIPLALLLKLARDRRPHMMIGHVLTPLKKALVVRALRLHTHIRWTICHASYQERAAVDRLGMPAARVAPLPYQVDERGWRPAPPPPPGEAAMSATPMIATAGLERRDYVTLVAAMEGLPARLVIAAASHWSRRRDGLGDRPLPDNVRVEALDYARLRDLYAASAFVVVPLEDVDFQAGITTILEAMAMGKAVIVSHTLGQDDVVIDRRAVTRGSPPRVISSRFVSLFGRRAGYGPTGLYVPPGDVEALRRAIRYLLDHPTVAATLGENGRRLIEEVMGLDAFVARVAALGAEAVGEWQVEGARSVATSAAR